MCSCVCECVCVCVRVCVTVVHNEGEDQKDADGTLKPGFPLLLSQGKSIIIDH